MQECGQYDQGQDSRGNSSYVQYQKRFYAGGRGADSSGECVVRGLGGSKDQIWREIDESGHVSMMPLPIIEMDSVSPFLSLLPSDQSNISTNLCTLMILNWYAMSSKPDHFNILLYWIVDKSQHWTKYEVWTLLKRLVRGKINIINNKFSYSMTALYT